MFLAIETLIEIAEKSRNHKNFKFASFYFKHLKQIRKNVIEILLKLYVIVISFGKLTCYC